MHNVFLVERAEKGGKIPFGGDLQRGGGLGGGVCREDGSEAAIYGGAGFILQWPDLFSRLEEEACRRAHFPS